MHHTVSRDDFKGYYVMGILASSSDELKRLDFKYYPLENYGEYILRYTVQGTIKIFPLDKLDEAIYQYNFGIE